MNEQSREIIKSLAEMAWADGEVSPEERALLIKVLIEAGADPQDMEGLDELLARPSDAPAERADLQSAALDEESRHNVMRALLIMSFMDGVLSFSEFAHIERVSAQLEISADDMETLRAEALEAAKSLSPASPE